MSWHCLVLGLEVIYGRENTGFVCKSWIKDVVGIVGITLVVSYSVQATVTIHINRVSSKPGRCVCHRSSGWEFQH